MKHLVILSAAAVALLNFSTAAAASAPASGNAINQPSLTATGARSPLRSAAAWQQIRGQYQLEDGATLTLSRHGRSLYAELGAQSPVVVHAAADGTLTTGDGSLVVEFRQLANGVMDGIKVTQLRRPG